MDLSKKAIAQMQLVLRIYRSHLHRFGNIHILLLLNRQFLEEQSAQAALGSISQAEPSIPIGTLDIDSTPPAIINSDHPDLIIAAA
jgi:hypothetical protein